MTAAETHIQFHRYQQNREAQYAPKFYDELNNQVKQFAAAYNSGQSLSNSLMAISSQQIRRLVTAVRIDGATIYGAKTAAALPKYKKPQQKSLLIKSRPTMGFNQRMIDLVNLYFEGEILADAEGITDTTRKEIQRILKEANAEGKGITWMVTQMEGLNKNRGKLIARTETVTAANAGAFLAALNVGLQMQKQWLATNDDRTRHDHAAISGRRIGMLDYFNVGDNTMLYPGDRTQENGLDTSAAEVCNCRCTCLYVAVRVNGKLIPFDYSQFRALLS